METTTFSPSEKTASIERRLAAEGRPVVDISSVYREIPASIRGVGGRCVCCGKPVGTDPVFVVGCFGSTRTIAAHVDDPFLEDSDPGYMGAFPVGVECAKRVSKLVRDAGGDPEAYIRRLS